MFELIPGLPLPLPPPPRFEKLVWLLSFSHILQAHTHVLVRQGGGAGRRAQGGRGRLSGSGGASSANQDKNKKVPNL